jgi:hypothetical protein
MRDACLAGAAGTADSVKEGGREGRVGESSSSERRKEREGGGREEGREGGHAFVPVHIILNRQRKRIIDHHLHVRDIQATGSHISCNQKRDLLRLELLDGGNTIVLALVSVDAQAIEALSLQVLLQPGCFLREGRREGGREGGEG